ncbi:splicing factor 3a [Pisolithus croceorrhizus]|nr:splicing factor 3a [Pisolithus croceorrhizus]
MYYVIRTPASSLPCNFCLTDDMDYQNRVGSKFGGGGVAGASETNVDRRERLRKLALETIDLAKDPYILRNHLGSLECRLCLTLHTNEGSYLAHTQGKKHQTNLARRAARDAKETQLMVAPTQSNVQRKVFLKIGRPGYRVTKPGVIPRRRFMSAWEQKREASQLKPYQYLILSHMKLSQFRIPAREIEDESG